MFLVFVNSTPEVDSNANHELVIGIGPKVTQSVITAAFLFAFKDALYAASVQARKNVPKGLSFK